MRRVVYMKFPRLSPSRRTSATVTENHCDEVRPLFAGSPPPSLLLSVLSGPLPARSSRGFASPRYTVKRVRSRVPGSSAGGGEEGRDQKRERESRGPLRYLLRACVPARYYYLYHAHNSSRSLKLFYYLFYTPPLPDSARSRAPVTITTITITTMPTRAATLYCYVPLARHPWERASSALHFCAGSKSTRGRRCATVKVERRPMFLRGFVCIHRDLSVPSFIEALIFCRSKL